MIIYLRLSDSLAKFLSLDGKLELQEVHPKGCPPPTSRPEGPEHKHTSREGKTL
jgi:hypothetical protein